MSEFDFDEIDKAVAGAIGDTPGEPEERSVEVTRPTPPAARRSAGRFMDMVHPSSDMRSHAAGVPKASRPHVSSETSEEPAGTQNAPEQSENTEPQVRPLESPFLPDAKVEKRPLGGAPAVEALLSQQPADLLLDAPDDPLLEATVMSDPIDFAAQQNGVTSEDEAETMSEDALDAHGLDSDWEEIKGTPFAAPLEDTPPKEGEGEVTPEGEDAPAIEEDVHEESADGGVPTLEPEVPAGPSSITQQYTEQPRSQQESGAIYDTENYHQPVTAPQAKRHAGAWTVLWISLLVILGAGAGVAFYLFILPNL